jgi:hypothetical protein
VITKCKNVTDHCRKILIALKGGLIRNMDVFTRLVRTQKEKKEDDKENMSP